MRVTYEGESIEVLKEDKLLFQIRLDDPIASIAGEIKNILKYFGEEVEE